MGGVCQAPDGQWFVWRSPFSATTLVRLVLDTNPGGDVTINDLELATPLAQVQIFAPVMETLDHIRTSMGNTAMQGWDKRESVRTAAVVGPILWDLALPIRTHKIHSSVRRISGTDNKMAGAASRLTPLTNNMFLCHFYLIFPHRKPWWMLTLPSECKRRLTSTLHRKRCRVDFLLESARKTQLPGANGASSMNGRESHPTSNTSDIPSVSSRSLQSACTPDFC